MYNDYDDIGYFKKKLLQKNTTGTAGSVDDLTAPGSWVQSWVEFLCILDLLLSLSVQCIVGVCCIVWSCCTVCFGVYCGYSWFEFFWLFFYCLMLHTGTKQNLFLCAQLECNKLFLFIIAFYLHTRYYHVVTVTTYTALLLCYYPGIPMIQIFYCQML